MFSSLCCFLCTFKLKLNTKFFSSLQDTLGKNSFAFNLSCSDLGAAVLYRCEFSGRILHDLNFMIWGCESKYWYFELWSGVWWLKEFSNNWTNQKLHFYLFWHGIFSVYILTNIVISFLDDVMWQVLIFFVKTTNKGGW